MEQGADSRLECYRTPESRSVVLIRLSGELDRDTADLLREAVVRVAAEPGEERRLSLDLSDLTYCDTAGLFTLLGICQALDTIGIKVWITKVGPVACVAISRAGLQYRLPLVPP
ncbi:STAS domain-containing protein [Streptomyces sp. PA5.6]|uniref:STAS domain-containing protein n=1 Tax=Streptomyces sp. PA5.6 TaxID=3035651 RepID=UPI003904DCB2